MSHQAIERKLDSVLKHGLRFSVFRSCSLLGEIKERFFYKREFTDYGKGRKKFGKLQSFRETGYDYIIKIFYRNVFNPDRPFGMCPENKLYFAIGIVIKGVKCFDWQVMKDFKKGIYSTDPDIIEQRMLKNVIFQENFSKLIPYVYWDSSFKDGWHLMYFDGGHDEGKIDCLKREFKVLPEDLEIFKDHIGLPILVSNIATLRARFKSSMESRDSQEIIEMHENSVWGKPITI